VRALARLPRLVGEAEGLVVTPGGGYASHQPDEGLGIAGE